MSVSAITGSSAVALHGPPRGRPEPPPMTNTAGLLGMSADELRDAQKSGTTLTDLAAQKGVSKDDLVTSIASDLKVSKPDGAPELSDDQLTEMATNIADGKRPQGPPPPRAQQSGEHAQVNLESLADKLGMSTDELLDQLVSGTPVGAAASSGYGSSSASTGGGVIVDQYAY